MLVNGVALLEEREADTFVGMLGLKVKGCKGVER
jgi:hypothetical protein